MEAARTPIRNEVKKYHTSAVVIMPPPDTWGPIQAIREKYDRAYRRWPPHINLYNFTSLFALYASGSFEHIMNPYQEMLSHAFDFLQ